MSYMSRDEQLGLPSTEKSHLLGWPFGRPAAGVRYVVVQCWDCGARVEVEASVLDEDTGSLWRAPEPLRVIGWKRLPMGEDDFGFRCPDCRLSLIEGCPTVSEEIG
jgi:hypothetical protein